MDKYEYQICADQIKSLISERRYAEAMNIADTIDWRKVRSVSMLCTVSEVYKINKKYEEARDILFLAYDRYPGGRTIVYALCELAIKLNDVLQAKELYEEYVRLAPEDTGKYILLYKLYEALDVSIEERIEVLEEFKKRDYRERWAYELAYLYHKIGQETRCVQECDELILWFGDGKYVKQAMDLKMQHTRLSKEQQLKYEGRQEPMNDKLSSMQMNPVQQIYDTDPQAGNLQQIPMQPPVPPYEEGFSDPYMAAPGANGQMYSQTGPVAGMSGPIPMMGQDMQITAEPVSTVDQRTAQMLNTSEIDSIQVQPVNVGMYNTMDLQNGLSENIKKFFERENEQSLDDNVLLSADPESYDRLYENDTMDLPEESESTGPIISGTGPVISVSGLDVSENEMDDVPGNGEDVQITTFMPAEDELADMKARHMINVGSDDPGEFGAVPKEGADDVGEFGVTSKQGTDDAGEFGAASGVGTDEEEYVREYIKKKEESTVTDNGEVPKADKDEEAGEGSVEEAGAEAMERSMEEPEEPEEPAGESVKEAQEASSVESVEEAQEEPDEDSDEETDEIYKDDLDSIYKGWEEKKRENEEKRIREAKEKSLVQTTDIMAQLKGVLPEIEDIAKPLPPRPISLEDTGEVPEIEPVFKPYSRTAEIKMVEPATISIPLPVDEIEEELNEKDNPGEEDINKAVEEAIQRHDSVKEAAAKEKETEEEQEETEDKSVEQPEEKAEDRSEEEPEEESEDKSYEEAEDESGKDEEKSGEEPEDESGDESVEESEDKSYEETEEGSDDESEDESGDKDVTPEETEEPEETDKEDSEDNDTETGEDEEGSGEEKDESGNDEEKAEDNSEDHYSSMEISYDPGDDMNFDPKKIEVSAAVTKGEFDYLGSTDPGSGKDMYFREIMNIEDSEEEVFGDETAGLNEEASSEELTYSEDEEAARKAAFEITSELPEYPYEALEDYGEVEEMEVIEQPEGLEGIMRTNDLPYDDIARANYEAGIESEEDEETEEPKAAKKKHPSYMKLEKAPVSKRDFDKDEQLVFGRFEGIEWLKAQIVNAIDNIDMDPARGNVLVTGTEATGRISIAIDVVKVMQAVEDGFKGKVAKISGEALNKKDIPLTIKKLRHGALIIENSEGLTPSSARIVAEALELETEPVLVVMEGDTEGIAKVIESSLDIFDRVFNSRIELKEFTTDDLVAYGKGYAKEKEYAIDEMGVLALYRRIGDMQTLEHVVTLEEVREIVDNAIRHVDKKNMSHFMDVLLAKRYDDEDYIILREKDFIV
ncbi:MAG: hypothetical protein K6F34_09515 [Lachnospiraceae bacterium]|nr:hypothetical protein [Lachnospiraceae bacterium]